MIRKNCLLSFTCGPIFELVYNFGPVDREKKNNQEYTNMTYTCWIHASVGANSFLHRCSLTYIYLLDNSFLSTTHRHKKMCWRPAEIVPGNLSLQQLSIFYKSRPHHVCIFRFTIALNSKVWDWLPVIAITNMKVNVFSMDSSIIYKVEFQI